MKLLTIIGARPQFIKAATISRVVRGRTGIDEILVHTGQHYDANMSKIFFEELDIPEPKYNLGVHGGNHGAQTGKMLSLIEEVLLREKPDAVLVYGDTNSTLAGALAAAKLYIPIAHVEAGLRSFNKKMPEEINRILTDHTADMLFTPTTAAVKNLRNEGIDEAKIWNIGDVMLDVVNFYRARANERSSILSDLDLKSKQYMLATIHRAENTDDSEKLRKLFDSLEQVAEHQCLVLPIHPRTKKGLAAIGFSMEKSKIKLVDPVGYLDMVQLESHSKIIITDSGGVQKEAFFHKVPCVTLRNETEWVELVANDYNFLADSENLSEVLVKAQATVFDDAPGLYGNGDASLKIVDALLL